MLRGRVIALCVVIASAQAATVNAQGNPAPLALLDVPYISQSEALCGGAAAAMVMRYWGEPGVDAASFAGLVDRSASGIPTKTLIAELQHRGWMSTAIAGTEEAVRAELARGRPVIALIEDRPSAFHYVVVVGWHDRGVIVHDPARAPFRVTAPGDFDRRWKAAGRWMAIVVPNPARAPATPIEAASAASIPGSTTSCDERVRRGVALAQSEDLAGAERTLSGALDCPAAVRELAGVRVLQQRWPEASELAAAAVRADSQDDYSWKLLATSLFVQDRRLEALRGWNRTQEPRVDRVQIDGLSRTRHNVVERLIGLQSGTVLTPGLFVRAQRRLAELPSARAANLEYQPTSTGLAVVRGTVSERGLLPSGAVSLSTLAAMAVATREVRLTTGSLTGGGEQISAAWRYWPQRPRVAVGIAAPTPWGGGIWSANGYTERQEFDRVGLAPSERGGAWLEISAWQTSGIRWTGIAGVDRWRDEASRAHLGGALRVWSIDRRVNAAARVEGWGGAPRFATGEMRLTLRSTPELRGIVVIGDADLQGATQDAKLALWRGGDTGQARTAFLRAHPILNHGRLRVDRLGQWFAASSLELQRWWRVGGPLRTAGAVFGDAGRTMKMRVGGARTDVDIGVGARLAVAGMPGVFRVDLARGLQDGEHALAFIYEP